jgi:hypothetical protein
MRFICIQDYINYIKENPECTSGQLHTGVIIGRRLQDDLLEVVKNMLEWYVPKPTFSKERVEGEREIVLFKENVNEIK